MIITALNNNLINEKLQESYSGQVYAHDISCMEGVIELVSRLRDTEKNITVITKDTLDGRLTKELYIKQIKLAYQDVRVIVITRKLENNFKEFLFANEVFNVIEAENITISEIINSIESTDKVIYQNCVSEAAAEYVTESMVIPKKLIAVYGTSGSRQIIYI